MFPGHHGPDQRERRRLLNPDAGAVHGATVTDAKAADLGHHSRPNPEHARRRLSADGQSIGARPLNRQVLVDVELTARQSDRAWTAIHFEVDRVAGRGVHDRLTQAPWPAVVGIDDRHRRRLRRRPDAH
jgi:hypothetical protein